MKLLITGSTGFVGRNLLLQALDDSTWGDIILPVRNKAKLLEQLQKENIDPYQERLHICATSDNNWVLEEVPQADVAIHCAGLTFSRQKEPYFETHVQGTKNLIEKLPPECRIIVLSSLSASGPTPQDVLLRDESFSNNPVSWYGASKRAMEEALSTLSPERLLILRPPLIFGPRDTATTPLFQMVRGRVRIKPGMRTKEYSWIDVEDLCRALLLAAQQDWQKRSRTTYFIANNKRITDWQLLKTAAEVLNVRGITLPCPLFLLKMIAAIVERFPSLHQAFQSLGPDRIKEIIPQRWVIDSSKFQRDFGWEASTTFHDSLQHTATWLAAHSKI